MMRRVTLVGLVALLLAVGSLKVPAFVGLNHQDCRSVDIAPDNQTFLTAGGDKTIKLWDLKKIQQINGGAPDPALIRTFTGHTSAVYRAKFFPDGQKFVSCSPDRTVRVYDITTSTAIRVLTDLRSDVYDVDVSPDGKKIVACDGVGSVVIWDAETYAVLANYKRYAAYYLTNIRFTADGSKFVCAGVPLWNAFHSIEVRDTSTTQVLANFDGGNQFAISPDGARIVTNPTIESTSGVFWTKNLATGSVIQTLGGHSARVNCFAYSADGKQFLSGASQNDGTVRLWDAATSSCLQMITGLWMSQGRGVSSMDFSSDRKLIAVAGNNGVVELVNNPYPPKSHIQIIGADSGLDFGDVDHRDATAARSFTIRNTGDDVLSATLSVTGAQASQFSFDSGDHATIPTSSSLAVNVTFNPELPADGARKEATVQVYHNDPATTCPLTVTLLGSSVPVKMSTFSVR